MSDLPSSDEIRAMVRDVLREVMPTRKAPPVESAPQPAASAGLTETIRAELKDKGEADMAVRMVDDGDLNEFVRALTAVLLDPDLRAAIASGRVRFNVSGAAPAPDSAPAPGGDYTFDKGVLNETKIAKIAKTYDRVVLGRAAVLTPLARDKAREIKLEIVRKRP